MTETDRHFALLARQLRESLARAIVSQMGPQSGALREHLEACLGSEPGSKTSLLAPPVFEGLFDWASSGKRLRDIPFFADGLADRLSQGVKLPLTNEEFEPLFPDEHRAHQHQLEAWEALITKPKTSVLVRTGTASGKTEAFLVPILNDLAREVADKKSPLVGVRALFLYPLNALISSQRDRLAAGTAPFDGRIRFALYNGNTPERLGKNLRINGPEICDRFQLRETPPPMLVTNATMLEYMLVRQNDASIIEQSKGKLRWIVLDEAHTYIGSAAAEIALLLRRVLHTFEVRPEDVRFVATSATIGGDDKESEERLATFLSDLAGVDRSQVVVVSGHRVAPRLPTHLETLEERLPSPKDLSEMNDLAVGEAFASNRAARELRDGLSKKAMSITEISTSLAVGVDEALGLLDHASRATVDEKPFLPLRGHHFIRTQPGVWVCTNPSCSGRDSTPLSDSEWPFGKLFFERRVACDCCEAQVTELVLCRSCGEEYAVTLASADGGWLPSRWVEPQDSDDSSAADDILDSDQQEAPALRNLELLCGPNGARDGSGELPEPLRFDPVSGKEEAGGQSIFRVSRTSSGGFRCGRCGSNTTIARTMARPARLGLPFVLKATLPTVAEHVPTMPGAPSERPSAGRRLITFTDSRQGTARHFVGGQVESERLWTRAWLYNHLWSESEKKIKLQGGVSGEERKAPRSTGSPTPPSVESGSCEYVQGARGATCEPRGEWRSPGRYSME